MILEETKKFIIRNSYEEQVYGNDDMLTVCRFCGGKGWMLRDVQHEKNCELLPVLEELSNTERGK